jgi:hypothetical protein
MAPVSLCVYVWRRKKIIAVQGPTDQFDKSSYRVFTNRDSILLFELSVKVREKVERFSHSLVQWLPEIYGPNNDNKVSLGASGLLV